MKIYKRIATVVAMSSLLAACGGKQAGADNGSGDDVVHLAGNGTVAETVNGVKVPGTLVDAVAKGRGLDPDQPAQRKQALDEVTQYILLAQQADKLKVDQQPDLAAMAEAARLQGVANAVLMAYGRAHPVTDKMVAEDYARQVKEAGNTTYRFTQLLFNDKADADKAAAELASGKPFKAVYDEWSGKVRDAQQYSDVFPRQLPDPLAQALTALDAGQTTPRPVQSKLGWHLLHLDGTDNFKAPPLAGVKDKVKRGMEEKQAQAWLESLKDKASITVSQPPKVSALGPANSQTPSGHGAAVSPVVAKGSQAAATPAPPASAH